MEQLFKEIANEENCELSITHQKSYTHLFQNYPLGKKENGFIINALSIRIRYNENYIDVINKIADNHIGSLECILAPSHKLAEFKIEKGNPIWKILSRRDNILKINCKNSNLKKILQEKLIELKLEEIANESLFEPIINGLIENNSFKIKTNYHLAFPKKKEVLRPLIKLYKVLIDYSIK